MPQRINDGQEKAWAIDGKISRHEHSHSFFPRFIAFIAVSRLEASALSWQVSLYTSRNGPRPLVYLAPFPAACAAMRRSRSFVMPVYRLLSAHCSI